MELLKSNIRFDEEVYIGRLDIVRLLDDLREKHQQEFGSYTTGEPMFSTAEELLMVRKMASNGDIGHDNGRKYYC